MGYFKKKDDKKSGDGLALTEWNDLNSALSGDAGLTLAVNELDNIGIGTLEPDPNSKLTVNGDVNVGGSTNKQLHVRRLNGKDKDSAESGDLYLNHANQKSVHIGSPSKRANLNVNGIITGDGSGLTNLSVGETGLNIATEPGSSVGIGTSTPVADAKLTVNGDVNIGGKGFARLHTRHIDGKDDLSEGAGPLFLNRRTEEEVVIGSTENNANLTVQGTVTANKFTGIGLVWGPIEMTDYINGYDGGMNYALPEGAVMVGLYSHHSNSKEDRRFRIKYRTLTLSGV